MTNVREIVHISTQCIFYMVKCCYSVPPLDLNLLGMRSYLLNGLYGVNVHKQNIQLPSWSYRGVSLLINLVNVDHLQ